MELESVHREETMEQEQERITVRQDGTGDAATVAEAFLLLEKRRNAEGEKPIEIHIGSGIYKEKLELRQSHVTLLGEPGKTVITYDDYALFLMPDGVKRGTFRTQTMFFDGEDITVKGITFENPSGFGAKVGQAVAVYADGASLFFENCRFLGRQDTLFTAPLPPTVVEAGGFRGPKEHAPRNKSVQYYKNCYIEGDVDFIFGGATAFFEECEIRSLDRGQEINGYVTAASTPEGQSFGYVFDRCRFTSNCPAGTVYLGRPWRSFAKVVIMHSELGAHIRPEGWHDWNKEEPHRTTYFAEFDNYGPGADTTFRVPWSYQLTAEEAKNYTKESVFSGGKKKLPAEEEELCQKQ